MTFYKWLNNLSEDPTPEGDFARDALRDNDFPKKAKTWSTIENYLYSVHAIDEAIEAGENAFNLYEKETHHHN